MKIKLELSFNQGEAYYQVRSLVDLNLYIFTDSDAYELRRTYAYRFNTDFIRFENAELHGFNRDSYLEYLRSKLKDILMYVASHVRDNFFSRSSYLLNNIYVNKPLYDYFMLCNLIKENGLVGDVFNIKLEKEYEPRLEVYVDKYYYFDFARYKSKKNKRFFSVLKNKVVEFLSGVWIWK